jgi:multiple sugar transport system substrate-binding protein
MMAERIRDRLCRADAIFLPMRSILILAILLLANVAWAQEPNGGAVVSAKSAHLDAAKKLAKFWSLDPQTNATLAKNDAGLIATKGFKQPSGLPLVFYRTAALYQQKSTKKHPLKNVDVMFFNNGDRASVPGMDGFYATAAQNILLGRSVQSQLKFLDTQWNKAAKSSG